MRCAQVDLVRVVDGGIVEHGDGVPSLVQSDVQRFWSGRP